MSQPQDVSHPDCSDRQPLVVYVPIPCIPPQTYDPQSQLKWQQSLFWQINPLLGASSQSPQTTSLPFPTSIAPAEAPVLTLSSQVTAKLTTKEVEEDREFERKKRNSEGNFGKVLLCISYCYALGALTWFISQGTFKNSVAATVTPTTAQSIDVQSIESQIFIDRITQAAIVGNFERNFGNLSVPIAQTRNTFPIAAAPSQVIPVPPPPAPTIIANGNIATPVNNNSNKTKVPPAPTTTATKKTATTPKQFKPNKLPAVIKTPPVVKIPTAPNIQIVPPAPNNSAIVNVPPPPANLSSTLPQPNQTTIPENQTATSPLAMVDAPTTAIENGYMLMGVLEAGERSGALFQIDGVVQTVRINETIGNSGWKLVSIVNGRANIARNDRTRSIGVEEKL
jgi:hypothetical protein